MAAVSPTINRPQSSPDDEPRTAASLFLDISDDLNRLNRIIEGVFMATADVSIKEQQEALRELLEVARQKSDAMVDAMQEARDLLKSEQKREVA
jgi:hypothetical protein